jgi:hypothetical protein
MIECLVNRKYELELWRQEIKYLKSFQRKYQQWPSSFDYIHVGVPSFIETITDDTVRQQLMNQHQELLHEYKGQLLRILINIGKENSSKIQTLFKSDMNMFWTHQNSLPIEQRLSPSTIHCIVQRFNIVECKVDAIYCHYNKK